MAALYAQNLGLKSHALGRAAQNLRETCRHKSRLSPLVFMSDPARTGDVTEAVAGLPKGCALIYRHFGEGRRAIIARALRQVTHDNAQQLLIGGGDVELAMAVKADGVHFKRDAALSGPHKLRAENKQIIITMAGLKTGKYRASLSCLDGLFISSIFPSQSPSAGEAIGTEALKARCEVLPVPIFALGGITAKTAPQLLGSGASGLAAIDGFRT